VEQRQRAKESSAHTVSDVGRYRLIAELARGGMGVVYLALVRGPGGFNKLFVVKELKAHLAEEPSLVTSFLEEARISAKLNHPNVVQTIEVGSDGDRHYIAMEFLDGQALNRMLSRAERVGVPVPIHFHLRILSDMLQGLDYVHELADFDGRPLGLVHRDVSPHNLFVTYDGQVKVLDFGIAKVLDSSHQTNTGVLKGKIAYMSPEQAGGMPVDRRTDVFAAGVMLWEAVAGARMWGSVPNDLQILRAVTTGAIPNVRRAKPDVDEALARIIDRATAFDAHQRYATAADFQADLDACIPTLGGERVDARALGKFVGDVFADERMHLKRLVEAQLRLVEAAADPQAIALPTLAPHGGTNGTPSATAALDSHAVHSASGERAVVRADTAPGGTGPSARPFWKTGAVPLLLVAGVLSAAGTVALRGRSGGATMTAAAPASTSAAAPPPRAPDAPVPAPPQAVQATQAIQAIVTVSPASATIAIDGAKPQVGPFARTLVRDGASHTVVIEAAGYEPKTLQFAADADRTFDIQLEPRRGKMLPRASNREGTHAPAAPAASVAAPPAAPTPAVPPAPAVSAAEPNRQRIDTNDPYAR
jgi:serine/threonine-protein kinase